MKILFLYKGLRQYYEYNPTLIRPSPYEAEFRSYGILLNLGESNILREIQRWPQHIRHSEHVRFALSIYFAYNSRNYVKFFRLIRSNKCLYLHACILHRYFYKVRCEAFKTIFTAFRDNKEKLFPLTKLVNILGFDDEDEAYDYCNLFGLEVSEDSNVLMRSFMNYSCFKLEKSNEDRLKLRRSNLLVESKFKSKLSAQNLQLSSGQCLSEIISGQSYADGTKQPSIFGIKSQYSSGFAHKLYSSFTDDGYYCSDEINQLLTAAKQSFIANNSKKSSIISKKVVPIKKNLDPKIKNDAKPNSLKRTNSIIKKAQMQSIKSTQKVNSAGS